MPKIIEGLRESMVAQARRMLFAEGYNAVTMRAVAKSCGVAVGTVYNYFPSKDMLIASVMLEDWLKMLEQIRSSTQSAARAEEGLGAMYEALADFCGIYASAWSQYCAAGGNMEPLRERHTLLLQQLTELIEAICARHGLHPDGICLELTTEIMLARAQHRADFKNMAPALIKLIV